MTATRLEGLRGSFPPLVTPFRDGAIDFEAYAGTIERQIEGGSHGILVNGTTAEPSTLTVSERNEIVTLATKTAAGRLPVVAATGSQSLEETIELTRHAEAAGADALLIVTPYYLRPPQRGLVSYFRSLCEQVELPVMIYHIPGRAAVSMDVESFARIKETCPNLVGVKHASPDLGFVTKLLRELGHDFRIFVGLEELSFPLLCMGAAGLMNAVGNLDPARVAALCEAVDRGDLDGARALAVELAELSDAIFFETNPIPLKYMLRRLGVLTTNEHRLPMAPAEPALEQRLDGVLERAGLL
jgi:4-hydroxy-tetrahydrodipicolinate synthase